MSKVVPRQAPKARYGTFFHTPPKISPNAKKMALHPNITYLSSLVQLDSQTNGKKDGEDGGIRTHAVAH